MVIFRQRNRFLSGGRGEGIRFQRMGACEVLERTSEDGPGRAQVPVAH